MTREDEIKNAADEYSKNIDFSDYADLDVYSAFIAGANWADLHPTSPWITDRMPEIKGSTSDAVVLLVDGMFYKVSHFERRKDGTEFWCHIHPEEGDEVDAWMPIPTPQKSNNN